MYDYDYGYVCYSCGAGYMRRGQSYSGSGMIAMHGCRECGGNEPREPPMDSFDHMEDNGQT